MVYYIDTLNIDLNEYVTKTVMSIIRVKLKVMKISYGAYLPLKAETGVVYYFAVIINRSMNMTQYDTVTDLWTY